MKFLHPLFFKSCRSNKDAAFPPEKPKSGDTASSPTFSFRRRPSAGAAADDLFLCSKKEKWHSVSYQSRAAASPQRKIGSGGGGTSTGSLAVVKRSEDPREDFRLSMAEMVVEKGMYEVDELEKLLHCFLSLNSRHHHRVIVAAFVDMWEELFPVSPGDRRNAEWAGGHDSW